MKFQKKMIVLTTAAVATFGLIACGAAVADSKKDDEAAVKPMAMKSAPAKAGMKGGCSHGAKGGMGGCSHGAKGGKMGGCDHGAKGGKMGGCEHGAKGGMMNCCDNKKAPAAAPKAEPVKK